MFEKINFITAKIISTSDHVIMTDMSAQCLFAWKWYIALPAPYKMVVTIFCICRPLINEINTILSAASSVASFNLPSP